MAKTKSSPKAQENQKPKGAVPNYAKKVKVVEVGPKLPTVKLTYHGISTAMIASIYDKKNMATMSHVDDQLCWQAAVAFVYDFKHDMHEINETNYLTLASVARKLFTATAQTVKNISGNYQLDAAEIESFGSIVTKGIFRKRQRFWHYVELSAKDLVPPNLGFHLEDALWSNVYERAAAFGELVMEYSVIAKALIDGGADPEMNMCISKGKLSAPSGIMSKMPEEQKIKYQMLKFWVIGSVPAPIKPPFPTPTDLFKEMSTGQKMLVAALFARTFLDKKAA